MAMMNTKLTMAPYGKGWLVKIKPNDANDINDLMDAEAYKALVNE